MYSIGRIRGSSACPGRAIVRHLLAVAALALVLPVQSADLKAWEWRNPLPQGDAVRCLAGDGTHLVAAGVNGTVLRSEDGREWAVDLNAVESAWVCNALVQGNGRWAMAVHNPSQWNHQLLLSDDAGRTWTQAGSPAMLRDIVWYEGRFLAVGSKTGSAGPEGTSRLFESTTGEGGWTELASWPRTIHGFAATAGRYVAVGAGGVIYVSGNKTRWFQAASRTAATLRHVRFGGGLFVAVGDGGTVLSSPDGLIWTVRTGATDSRLRGVAAGPSGFAAVGDEGVLLTSADGLNWSAQSSASGRTLHSVVPHAQSYLAGGEGGDLYRREGEVWTPQRMPAAGAGDGLHDLVGGPHGLVAAGTDGLVMYSATGTDWQTATVPTDMSLKGAVYGGGQYVVVGARGTVLLSSAGREWQYHRIAQGGDLNAVAWRRGQYVAVGDDGFIARSPDGVDWTVVEGASARQDLIRVRAAGAGWVALGREGEVLFSADGASWEPRPLRDGYTYIDLVHDGERFLIVGTGGASSVILQSVDGRLWEEHAEVDYQLSALAPDAGAPNTYLAAAADASAHYPVWLYFDGLRDYTPHDGITSVHRLVSTGGAMFALGPGGGILQSGTFTAPGEPSDPGAVRLSGAGGCAATRGGTDLVLLFLLAGALAQLARRRRSSDVRQAHR